MISQRSVTFFLFAREFNFWRSTKLLALIEKKSYGEREWFFSSSWKIVAGEISTVDKFYEYFVDKKRRIHGFLSFIEKRFVEKYAFFCSYFSSTIAFLQIFEPSVSFINVYVTFVDVKRLNYTKLESPIQSSSSDKL